MKLNFSSKKQKNLTQKQDVNTRNSHLKNFIKLIEKYDNAKKFLENATLEKKQAALTQVDKKDQLYIINKISIKRSNGWFLKYIFGLGLFAILSIIYQFLKGEDKSVENSPADLNNIPDFTAQVKERALLDSKNTVNNVDKTSLTIEDLIQALKRKYTDYSVASIKRLLYEKRFPISNSFINLAIVEQKEQQQKEQQELVSSSGSFRDSAFNYYEIIHKPEQLLNLQDIFLKRNNDRQDTNHILIEGRAGIGKTIFCQYLANQWALGNDVPSTNWLRHFKAVIWLPLRVLKDNDKNINLLEFIYQECLLMEDRKNISLVDFSNQLDILEKQHKVLYLLDGYDEIVSLLSINQILKDIIEKLLQKDLWLITSRSNSFSYHQEKVNRHLEIIGFTETDISRYVKQFFQDFNIENKAKYVLNALNNNNNLKAIAYIPINLELICSVWKEDYQDVILQQANLTMTSLYQGLTQLLARRFLQERRGINIEGMLSDEYESHSQCAKILQFLEALAWELMQKNTLIFKPKSYNALIKKHFPDNEQRNIINEVIYRQYGLLKSTGDETTSSLDQQYYFIHLTFQEFLAARYIVHCLQADKAPNGFSTMEKFIKNKKYDIRFEVVWIFTAGILYNLKSYKELNYFFDRLSAEPYDLSGFYHRVLLSRCYQETALSDKIDGRVHLQLNITQLSNEYLYYSYTTHSYTKRVPTLINLFKSCNYITQSFISNWVNAIIVNPNQYNNMPQRIFLIARHNSYLTEALFDEFSKEQYISGPIYNIFLYNLFFARNSNFGIAAKSIICNINKNYDSLKVYLHNICQNSSDTLRLDLQLLVDLLQIADKLNLLANSKVMEVISLLSSIKIEQASVTGERLDFLISFLEKNKQLKDIIFKLLNEVEVKHIVGKEHSSLIEKLNKLLNDNILFIDVSQLLLKFEVGTPILFSKLFDKLNDNDVNNQIKIISIFQKYFMHDSFSELSLTIKKLMLFLGHENHLVKISTIQALGQMGKDKLNIILQLKRIMEDTQENLEIRDCAIRALAEAKLHKKGIIDYLVNKIIFNEKSDTKALVYSAIDTVLKLSLKTPQIDILLPQLLKSAYGVHAAQIFRQTYLGRVISVDSNNQITSSISPNIDYDFNYIKNDTLVAIATNKDIEFEYRRDAMDVLGLRSITDERIINAIAELLQDKEFIIRQDAANILGRLDNVSGNVVTALEQAIKDPIRNVVEAAINALAELSRNSIEAYNALNQLLNCPITFNYNDPLLFYTPKCNQTQHLAAIKLFEKNHTNSNIIICIEDFLRLSIELPSYPFYRSHKTVKFINKMDVVFIEHLIGEILCYNDTAIHPIVQKEINENSNVSILNSYTIKSWAYNIFLYYDQQSIFFKRYVTTEDSWLIDIFYAQQRYAGLPVYMIDNNLYFYEKGELLHTNISDSTKVKFLNDIALLNQKLNLNIGSLEIKPIAQKVVNIDSIENKTYFIPKIIEDTLAIDIIKPIQSNSENFNERIELYNIFAENLCPVKLGLTDENNIGISNYEQADELNSNPDLEKPDQSRKLLSIDEVYDLVTSNANINQPQWCISFFKTVRQISYYHIKNWMADISLPLFNTVEIRQDVRTLAHQMLLYKQITNSKTNIFSLNSALPKQATSIDQLCLLHYTICHLQKSRYWSMIGHYFYSMQQLFLFYRPHVSSNAELASLQHCQQLVHSLINRIKHVKTTHIGNNALFGEVLIPILHKLRRLKITIMLLLKQPISSSQLFEVISTVNEIQKQLEDLNLKQLNKSLRYADIRQNRLKKRARKAGQSSVVELLVEYRKHEKQTWTIRQETEQVFYLQEQLNKKNGTTLLASILNR